MVIYNSIEFYIIFYIILFYTDVVSNNAPNFIAIFLRLPSFRASKNKP